jgi:hypothetical protein
VPAAARRVLLTTGVAEADIAAECAEMAAVAFRANPQPQRPRHDERLRVWRPHLSLEVIQLGEAMKSRVSPRWRPVC